MHNKHQLTSITFWNCVPTNAIILKWSCREIWNYSVLEQMFKYTYSYLNYFLEYSNRHSYLNFVYFGIEWISMLLINFAQLIYLFKIFHASFVISDIPNFKEGIGNLTIPVGREAILPCIVDNLSTYKVWLIGPFLVRTS